MVAVKVELAQPPSMIEKQVKKSAKKEGAEGPVKDSSPAPSQPAQSLEGKCAAHCHHNSWLHVAIFYHALWYSVVLSALFLFPFCCSSFTVVGWSAHSFIASVQWQEGAVVFVHKHHHSGFELSHDVITASFQGF